MALLPFRAKWNCSGGRDTRPLWERSSCFASGVAVEAGGAPLYRRIQADLRDRVTSGELAPGTQVDTELELMRRYGVSRATVRQALAGLITEGLLEVRRGRGTFVRGSALEHQLGGFQALRREIERQGKRPGTRVRDVSVVPAAAETTTMTTLPPGRPPRPTPPSRPSVRRTR